MCLSASVEAWSCAPSRRMLLLLASIHQGQRLCAQHVLGIDDGLDLQLYPSRAACALQQLATSPGALTAVVLTTCRCGHLAACASCCCPLSSCEHPDQRLCTQPSHGAVQGLCAQHAPQRGCEGPRGSVILGFGSRLRPSLLLDMLLPQRAHLVWLHGATGLAGRGRVLAKCRLQHLWSEGTSPAQITNPASSKDLWDVNRAGAWKRSLRLSTTPGFCKSFARQLQSSASFVKASCLAAE